MKNKRFTRFLALVMASSIMSFSMIDTAYAAKEEESAEGEEATEEALDNALHISTAEELMKFADACRVGSGSQEYSVVLDSDINLEGIDDFTGIDSFSGVFNGNGYTVSGFNINQSSGAIGFFGYIEEGAVVENLTIDGTIYSLDKNNYIGVLAGTNAGTIRNCTAKGIVTGTGNSGGIAGYNGGVGLIENCTNEADVYSLKLVAGIAGENRGSITGCTNNGNINSDSRWLELEDSSVTTFDLESIVQTVYDSLEVGIDIGGVAGYSVGPISNCTNNGTVGYQHAGKNVGGIAGRFCSKIDSCTNNGKVYGKQDIGGIAGQFEPTIVENGEDLMTYIHDLEHLSRQLSDDTAAASQDAENSIRDAAGNVQKHGDQVSSDINDISDHMTDSINDEVDKTKGRIDNASDSIKKLQGKLAEKDIDQIKEEKAEDIANLDYNTVISRIENLDSDVNRAQTTIGEYDTSWVGNEVKGQLDSKAQSEINNINDVTEKADDRVNTVTDDMSSSLVDMSDSMSKNRAIITKDINAINDKLADITSLAEEQVDNMKRIANGEDIIEDYSAIDAENEDASRIKNCYNKGYVNGDRNVGGVAGAIAVEGTDANDGYGKIDGNKYVTLAVLEDSYSNGIIELRKENAGGIVGNSSLGLIRNCEGKNRIISEEGNYIGGIVGYSKGTVSDCYSASDLEGLNYVGGIAGAAKKLRNCYTFTQIKEDANWGGEVIGDVISDSVEDVTTAHSNMMNSIFNNYYANDSLGGINNVSYNGIAEVISYDKLLSSAVANHFNELNVYYYNSDYKLVKTQKMDYGTSIDKLEYPDLETEKNMHLVWNGVYSDTITGNMFLVAEDADDVTVLASDMLLDNKPFALAQGVYYEVSSLTVKENTEIDKPYPTRDDSVIKCYDVSLQDVSLEEDPVSEIRFFVGDVGGLNIYQYVDGKWVSKKVEIAGSYAQCEMNGLEGTFAIETFAKLSILKWVICGIILVAIIILMFVAINKKNNKIQKK